VRDAYHHTPPLLLPSAYIHTVKRESAFDHPDQVEQGDIRRKVKPYAIHVSQIRGVGDVRVAFLKYNRRW